RLTNFCEGTDAVTAEIKIIDPLDADPGDEEEDDYTNYTFAWTVGGSAVTDLDLDTLANTIEFVPTTSSFNIAVTVTDLNGCSESFSEDHELQTPPSLDITGITSNQAFCVDQDTTTVTLGISDATQDGDNVANSDSNVGADIVSWSVDSYLEGNSGFPVTIRSGMGDPLPTNIDFKAWHTDASLGGSEVGGLSSYHTITVFYTDSTRQYQGVSTLCESSHSETIIIHPDPHVSIEVNGVDINAADFGDGFDEFCYDQEDVVLQGVQYVYDLSGITDTINLNSGQFVSNQTGNLGTNIGQAVFDPSAQHDAFHDSTSKFLNQSTIEVTFNFEDGNTCVNSAVIDLFVNPEPEVLSVTGLPSSDLASGRTSNNIRLTNFCEGTDAVTAEIKIIDPLDADPGDEEEDDYTNYTFAWTVGGSAVTDLDRDTLANTIEFVPTTNSFNIAVTVTDLNGCEESFSEDHELQTPPSLDLTGITDDESFCADDDNPTLGLVDSNTDGDGNTSADNGTFDLANVTSWTVDSYLEGNGGSPVTILSGSGDLPTIDLDAWHTDARLGGMLVGGV
ncbi:MAG: hypothetical protein HRT61_24660, partial [Ekhidna sp.]|nr:hypothetical protein [Ekhidna sp.]